MDLQELRNKINETDDELVALFVKRMQISAEIGEYKLHNNMNIYDPAREQAILDSLSEKSGSLYAPYTRALYQDIFALSRQLQARLHEISSIEYGLIGTDVSNSYNKWIHHAMGNRKYGLYSLSPELLPLLFSRRTFRGLSVTSPFKNIVPQYCDRLDDAALATGYVNTVVREADGSLSGYNTDYDGILYAAKKAGIAFAGKKIMILGNGAFAATAKKAAEDSGAARITMVTRTGAVNFRNYTDYRDADILINGTPVGMDPEPDRMPVDLSVFPSLSGLLDAVYTPVESRLIAEAEKRGIPCGNGLTILIEKSARSSALFGFDADEETCSDLYEELTSFIV